MATPASTEAGIMQPPQPQAPVKKGVLIKQLTDDELEHELNDMDLKSNVEPPEGIDEPKNQLDAFFLKHHIAQDANYDAMARVSHLEPQDVRDRLKDLGVKLPNGA